MVAPSDIPIQEPFNCPICHAAIVADVSLHIEQINCISCGTHLWAFRSFTGEVLVGVDKVDVQKHHEILKLLNVAENESESLNETESLHLVEILMEAEEILGITIPDDEYDKLTSMRIARTYILGRLAKNDEGK